MKRWFWVIGLIAVVAAGIFLGLRPQPVDIEAAAVTAGPLAVTVEEEGKTRLRSRYVVMAPVAGYMTRLHWKAGDPIAPGAVLANIDPPRPAVLDARTRDAGQARVAAAEAALAVVESRVATQTENVRAAEADLAFLRRQRDRDQALAKSGDIPAARTEKTVADLQRAEAAAAAANRQLATVKMEIESARAERNAARAAIAQSASAATGVRIPVIAPAAGRVIRVIRDSEGVVNPGEPLLEIGDARAIEVTVDLLSADAVKLSPGMKVLLDRWGGPNKLEARVRLVEPGGFTKISALGVEEQRVKVVADIVSPASEWTALGDGYRVEAAFVLWESNKVLQVPANAIFRTNGGWSVFAIEDGKAVRKTVQIGQRNGLTAEVTSGLKEGDQVVAHPDETVKDGLDVRAAAAPAQ